MLNMSAKIGEARERMVLKTRKCTGTSSLDRRIRSACASLKGASANSNWFGGFDWGDCDAGGGMPVMGRDLGPKLPVRMFPCPVTRTNRGGQVSL
jgi:hypothetical protein